MSRACQDCLARSWLLGRLGGHLEVVRSQIGPLLALDDEDLIAAVCGRQRDAIERERAQLDTDTLMTAGQRAGLQLLCRCDASYPRGLRALDAPPAVLYVAGGLERFLALCEQGPVAIVGARRASDYGTEMARSLGRDLAASGLTIISGMARGIDAAAHFGALRAGTTVAVLPGSADRPYPASHLRLYRTILESGVAVSELPVGTGARKWCFQARNRLIAGLSAMTVVVEASEGSGALPTAETARVLGRQVGAVPGRVTSPQASGPNALLARGATVIRDAQDVLDCLYGVGVRSVNTPKARPELTDEKSRVFDALADGHSANSALLEAGVPADRGLILLSELELSGWIRRNPGGSFTVVP